LQNAPPLNSRPKRERKHRSYTLCEVCNIQLNSAAQAQIHYNGKTHQKRLKHISNTGMICVSFSVQPGVITCGCRKPSGHSFIESTGRAVPKPAGLRSL
uniref:U1-type domain-containing protein n=1 Tax=Sinocyclocheilus grahami TaxID=75366 RepID=A0A672M1I1_SINGR